MTEPCRIQRASGPTAPPRCLRVPSQWRLSSKGHQDCRSHAPLRRKKHRLARAHTHTPFMVSPRRPVVLSLPLFSSLRPSARVLSMYKVDPPGGERVHAHIPSQPRLCSLSFSGSLYARLGPITTPRIVHAHHESLSTVIPQEKLSIRRVTCWRL